MSQTFNILNIDVADQMHQEIAQVYGQEESARNRLNAYRNARILHIRRFLLQRRAVASIKDLVTPGANAENAMDALLATLSQDSSNVPPDLEALYSHIRNGANQAREMGLYEKRNYLVVRAQLADVQAQNAAMPGARQKLARMRATPSVDHRIYLPHVHDALMANEHVFRVKTYLGTERLRVQVWLTGLVMRSTHHSSDYPGITLPPSVLTLTYNNQASWPVATLESTHRFSGYNGMLVHPHWVSEDNPCLGEYATVLRQMADTGSVEGMVWVYLEFLRWYDPHDVAGGYSHRWREEDPNWAHTLQWLEARTNWASQTTSSTVIRSENLERLALAQDYEHRPGEPDGPDELSEQDTCDECGEPHSFCCCDDGSCDDGSPDDDSPDDYSGPF